MQQAAKYIWRALAHVQMENKTADFYRGFEGEPEVVFALQSRQDGGIHAWEGYVDTVLNTIPPGSHGMWEGLLLPYHLEMGCWDDEKEMVVEDLPLFAAQLAAVDASGFDTETRRFYEALQAMVQQAHATGQTMVISRF